MIDQSRLLHALLDAGLDAVALAALRRTAREVDPRRAGPEVSRAAQQGMPAIYVGLLLAGLTPAEIEEATQGGLAAWRAARTVERFLGSSEEPRLRRMCRRHD